MMKHVVVGLFVAAYAFDAKMMETLRNTILHGDTLSDDEK
jgi:hypothetical protein